MKKLFILAWSVALMSIFTLAHAQTRDTALARIDPKKSAEKNETLTKGDQITAEETTAVKTTASPTTKFILPVPATDKSSILNTKVGPNGEDLWIENNEIYYINAEGVKVKVDKAALKNKPKHS